MPENLNNHPAMKTMRYVSEKEIRDYKNCNINPDQMKKEHTKLIFDNPGPINLLDFILTIFDKFGSNEKDQRNKEFLLTKLTNNFPVIAWRAYKPIYRFYPGVIEHIIKSDVNNIPWNSLSNLPYPGIYVEYVHKLAQNNCIGFIACNLTTPLLGISTMILSVSEEYGVFMSQIITHGKTHDQNINYQNQFKEQLENEDQDIIDTRNRMIAARGSYLEDDNLKTIQEDIIKILLYICAKNSDLVFSRPILKNQLSSAPIIITAAETFGRTLEKFRDSNNISNGIKTPHIRSGHFHGYWTGPKDKDQILVIKWISPVFVNQSLNLEIESKPFLIKTP